VGTSLEPAQFRALGLKTANLVGNSMGGYFALAHPERVKQPESAPWLEVENGAIL
jgi:hypothetical protein